MEKETLFILIGFIVYIGCMIIIRMIYTKKKNFNHGFFGGRNLNDVNITVSMESNSMSCWLIMGLPGGIYAFGTGQVWIVIGLIVGSILNWSLVGIRLRRYSTRVNDALTVQNYLSNRFHDKNKGILVIATIMMTGFFCVYIIAAYRAGGELISDVFGLNYQVSVTIIAGFILLYSVIRGVFNTEVTDFIQEALLLICITVIPILAYVLMKNDFFELLRNTGVVHGVSSYLDITKDSGEKVSIVYIISMLGWGLGYFGMPHVLVLFMESASEKELIKSKYISLLLTAGTLASAAIVGVIARAYLFPEVLENSKREMVIIHMIKKMFTETYAMPILGGVLLCSLLMVIVAAAKSQMALTVSNLAENIYKGIFAKKAKHKSIVRAGNLILLVLIIFLSYIACIIRLDIMSLVSFAWAGLGATFGPIILLSLYWKRVNRIGAFIGMLVGGTTVLIWEQLPLIKSGLVDSSNHTIYQTLAQTTGLYSLVIGFMLGLIIIVIVSLFTKAPDMITICEFEDVISNN